ncbi:MAG TPA: sulfite oxidase-like oxidoreductase [Acidobacteriota bacterium]|nr:sulfite oxidase-like oxidoreductase [Acidobacteriota bacterium]
MYEESKETRERRERERQMKAEGRLPPGQSLTLKWPVLQFAEVPKFDPATWDFRVFGLVEKPVRWTYAEFMALPKVRIHADMHCVTRWSRFDNDWEGVSFREVISHVVVKPEAKHAMIHGSEGYTTNVPLADLMRENVLFAYRNNGVDLSPDHGWPLRLVVPHLYAWKSAKWARGVELIAKETPGLWEQNGYHIYADPFKEQRYTDD